VKKSILLILLSIFVWVPVSFSVELTKESRASLLFNKYCSACHPKASRIKLGMNIAQLIRKPIASMPAFNDQKISDTDAQLIADHVKLQIDYSGD
jgi:hypothetical protein